MPTVGLLGQTCLLVLIMLFQHGPGAGSPGTPPAIQPPTRAQAPQLPVTVVNLHPPPPNAAKLKAEADQLAKLAQSIPPDVEKAAKGQLVQDLAARLKQIEKLSKQLRQEISM